MSLYASLPFLFLKFFFIDVPRAMIVYFFSLNAAFLQLFSLPLLVRTYFKPWKNEYRKGLVGVSIGIGIVIKTFVILADLFLFSALLLLESMIVLSFILWLPATIVLLFLK